jgi:hypothetical protein
LRQDRVLARVEATEQAGRLVQELTQLVLPRALESGLSQFEKLDAMDQRWMTAPTSNEEALIRVRKEGRWTMDASAWFGAACLLDEEGVLIYQPPLGGLAVPQPLELDALTPAQLSAWFACEEMWLVGEPDVRRVSALVALQVPERLIAVARWRTARSLLRGQGTIGSGILELRALQETLREVQSETGIPVRDLARLQLASLAGVLPEAERRLAVDGLCAELLQSP